MIFKLYYLSQTHITRIMLLLHETCTMLLDLFKLPIQSYLNFTPCYSTYYNITRPVTLLKPLQ